MSNSESYIGVVEHLIQFWIYDYSNPLVLTIVVAGGAPITITSNPPSYPDAVTQLVAAIIAQNPNVICSGSLGGFGTGPQVPIHIQNIDGTPLDVVCGPGMLDANADAYHAARANTNWATYTQIQKEAACRYATRYLDGMFRWKGRLAKYTQQLEWPRILGIQFTEVWDEELRMLDKVPVKIWMAVCELALVHLTVFPLNLVRAPNSILRSAKAGSVAIEYDPDFPGTTMEFLMALLKGIYTSGGLGQTTSAAIARS